MCVCVRAWVREKKEPNRDQRPSLFFPSPRHVVSRSSFDAHVAEQFAFTVRCANRHSLSMVAKSLSSSGEVDSKRVKNNFPIGKFNRQTTSSRRTDRGGERGENCSLRIAPLDFYLAVSETFLIAPKVTLARDHGTLETTGRAVEKADSIERKRKKERKRKERLCT